MKFYLFTDDEDILVGMRLAGIEGTAVKSREELLTALSEKLRDKQTGIIMLNTSLASLIPSELVQIKKTSRALITEIPDKGKDIPADSITRYVRNAIGIG